MSDDLKAVERVDPDRFSKPAPIMELTPEVIARLRELLDDMQRFASVTGLPWAVEPENGKPYLRASKETRGCTLAYGTIGSWKELELAALAVNALPAFLAATPSQDIIEKLTEALEDCAHWLSWCIDEHDAPDSSLERKALKKARAALSLIRGGQ